MPDFPTNYSIRSATQLDIPALIAADRAASELFRPTGLIPDMATIPESIPADVLAEGIYEGLLLCCAHKDKPIGFALCRQFDNILYLDQLSIDPAHGRKGLGTRLVDYVMLLAEERSVKTVALSTFRELKWNGPFYERLGFREIPRKKMTPWMLDIETAQAETLDITQRCFMKRPVKRGFFRRTG